MSEMAAWGYINWGALLIEEKSVLVMRLYKTKEKYKEEYGNRERQGGPGKEEGQGQGKLIGSSSGLLGKGVSEVVGVSGEQEVQEVSRDNVSFLTIGSMAS